MSVACNLINNEVSQLLQGKDLLQFKKIDDVLRNFKDRREAEHPDVKVGSNVTAAVS